MSDVEFDDSLKPTLLVISKYAPGGRFDPFGTRFKPDYVFGPGCLATSGSLHPRRCGFVFVYTNVSLRTLSLISKVTLLKAPQLPKRGSISIPIHCQPPPRDHGFLCAVALTLLSNGTSST